MFEFTRRRTGMQMPQQQDWSALFSAYDLAPSLPMPGGWRSRYPRAPRQRPRLREIIAPLGGMM